MINHAREKNIGHFGQSANLRIQFCLIKRIPMLFEVILSFERLPAHFTGPRDVVFMGPLVDHEVIWFRKPPLAKFADKFAFGPVHFPAELPPIFRLHLHYRKHG